MAMKTLCCLAMLAGFPCPGVHPRNVRFDWSLMNGLAIAQTGRTSYRLVKHRQDSSKSDSMIHPDLLVELKP